jgi:hypothetical protein
MPPPMSLDLRRRIVRAVERGSPIGAAEQLFVKRKALLRKAAARTREELWQAIGRLFASLPPSESTNFLSHYGYDSNLT